MPSAAAARRRIRARRSQPCQIEDAARLTVLTAECGTLEVPENPAAPDGRKIALYVARVPAINRRKAPDPLFLLAGGPGMARHQMYASAAPAFARIHRNRDIVLVDQRGTGKSNALELRVRRRRADARDDRRSRSRDDALSRRACSKRADVAYYTTSVAVRDLDRVRAALGYERINLYGGSYGTRVAEHYLRRFPNAHARVILDGVVPPELALGPAIALDAESALDERVRALRARCGVPRALRRSGCRRIARCATRCRRSP